jgi:hypothetical protein
MADVAPAPGDICRRRSFRGYFVPAPDAAASVAADELHLDENVAPAARILARAGTALDSAAMAAVLAGSVQGMGVVATWERVACPVPRALEQLRSAPDTPDRGRADAEPGRVRGVRLRSASRTGRAGARPARVRRG